MKKSRHRRTGSYGSGNFQYLQGNSPRNSPLRDRKVRLIIGGRKETYYSINIFPIKFELKTSLRILETVQSQ